MGQWLAGRAQLSADQSAKAPRHGLFSQHPKVGEGRGCFFNFFPTEIERIQICSSEKLQICSSESFSVLMHALQAEFQEQLVKIKEHTRQKDEEIEGGWYTEERLEKDLGWSKSFGPFFHHVFFLRCTAPAAYLAWSLVIGIHMLVRLLISKVKSYCNRFKSVLMRQGTFCCQLPHL